MDDRDLSNLLHSSLFTWSSVSQRCPTPPLHLAVPVRLNFCALCTWRLSQNLASYSLSMLQHGKWRSYVGSSVESSLGFSKVWVHLPKKSLEKKHVFLFAKLITAPLAFCWAQSRWCRGDALATASKSISRRSLAISHKAECRESTLTFVWID